MSTEEPVLLDREGSIAWIRFNRPKALNAGNEALARALNAHVHTVASDSSVRAVVLGSTGPSFLAGGDVAAFRDALPNADAVARRLLDELHPALLAFNAMPAPVIASLGGHVAGAGVSLALAADLAIAADDVKFNMAYAKIAATPDASSTWTLPRVVGLRKAMEIMMLSDTLDAAEALRLGLVNRVVPTAKLDEETRALARRLADGPTLAYGRIKRLLRGAQTATLENQLAAEQQAFVDSTHTRDFAEGLAAFFERRPAQFQGR